MNFIRWVLKGSRRFPDDLRAELDAEGVVLLEENLRGTVTLRHYRSPRRRASWAKRSISGAVAVTRRRLVVWAAYGRQVDVPFEHELFDALEIGLDKPDRLLIAFDAQTFHEDRSGRMEFRLRTPQAERIVETVRNARRVR